MRDMCKWRVREKMKYVKKYERRKNEWKDVSIFELTDQEVCDLRHMR